MRQLRELLNDTMSFMMNEIEDTKQSVNRTSQELDNYNKQAIDDGVAVENARKDSINASQLANKADNDLNESMNQVENLIAEIEKVPEIDLDTLADAERRFEVAKDIIDGTIATEINWLQNKLKEQSDEITRYELDLVPLEEQINFVNQLFLALPKRCFYGPPVTETNTL